MIQIREISPPLKQSGLSSFLISSPYNALVNQALYDLGQGVAYRHDKLNAYEIPAPFLHEVLDKLTSYDDIELKVLDQCEVSEITYSEENLTEEEIAAFKLKPFKHQIECVNFGLNRKRWLNLMGMGCGKTATLIYEAETLKRRGLIDHCLIICGVDSLRQQWKQEIRQFSDESVVVIGEKPSRTGRIYYETLETRAKQLKQPLDAFFVIVNIAALRSEKVVDAIRKGKNRFGFIGVDEIHRVSKKTTLAGKGLLKIKAEYMVGMSGSLVTNNPVSCYMPLSWTGNDSSILTTFKAEYIEKNQYGGIGGYRFLEHLKEELDFCGFRRRLEDLRDDFPRKTVSVEVVEMEDSQAKFYEAIKNGVKEEADKVDLKATNLLALTTRLRQASSDPSILTSQKVESCKIERCVELVKDLIEAGEKVVVMDVFKKSIYTLQEKLKQFNPLVGTGDFPDSEVSAAVRTFRTDPEAKLLLGTSQKIGTGFSIPEAHYLIMLSAPWTYAEFSQNVDRIYRINSTCPVYIKLLVAKNTIDENVWEIIDRKRQLSEYLVDNKTEAVENRSISDQEDFWPVEDESLHEEMRKIIRNL